MLAKSLIKRLALEERTQLRDGAIYTGLATGAFAYMHYRMYIKKEFLRSEGHYKFNQRITNCTPWKQMYFTWWRMPEEEWTVYHRFKPYFLLGQLDYSKEILIPKDKVINGQTVKGFDVVNPLYCYEGGRISMQEAFKKADPVKIDRSAIIIKRGWIPAAYRDKRSRPDEKNTRQLVKLVGNWRKGKNIHDYKIPNNPDANEWHNMALEDIGIYWDLPNFDEAKFYYFECLDMPSQGDQITGMEHIKTPVQGSTPDEVIEDHYGWRWNESTHKVLFRAFGSVAAASFGIAFLAL